MYVQCVCQVPLNLTLTLHLILNSVISNLVYKVESNSITLSYHPDTDLRERGARGPRQAPWRDWSLRSWCILARPAVSVDGTSWGSSRWRCPTLGADHPACPPQDLAPPVGGSRGTQPADTEVWFNQVFFTFILLIAYHIQLNGVVVGTLVSCLRGPQFNSRARQTFCDLRWCGLT